MEDKCRISGVICEFNPFHNGHAALLQQIRRDTGGSVVCVMSGNYVQRGDAAITDKFSRAQAALQNGADLVIELPLPWAMSGAEKFALGGVALLQALGNVDFLYFGSETQETSQMQKVAAYLCTPDFSKDVAPFLSGGMPFAAAREQAVQKTLGSACAALLRTPNTILGVEYCKALQTLHAAIEPKALLRVGADHHSPHPVGNIASASWIRTHSMAESERYMPTEMWSCIQAQAQQQLYPAELRHMERGILAFLCTVRPEELQAVPEVSEGIENRICAAAKQCDTLESLYQSVQTKRYTAARIRRIVLSAYLGIRRDLPERPPYLRILGMTSAGASILKTAVPTLPYLFRTADLKKMDEVCRRVFQLEAAADEIYSLCTPHRRPGNMDYTHRVLHI